MGISQSSNISKQQFTDLFESQTHPILIDRLNRILLIKCSQQQFYNSHSPNDIRHLIQERQDDVKSIIMFLYDSMNSLRNINLDESSTKMINILRLITQFIPVMFEASNRQFSCDLLWNQQVIQSEAQNQQSESNTPLMISIMKIILNLLFKKDLSVQTIMTPENITQSDENLQCFVNMFMNTYKYKLNVDILWKGFITVFAYPNDQTKFYEFRLVALQALQACISSSLFTPPYIECQYKDPKQKKLNNQNPALQAIYSLPLYPEILVSLISIVFYSEERNYLFRTQFLNKSSLEHNLHQTSIKMLMTLLFGQNCVQTIPELYQLPELTIITDYFKSINQIFPQFPQIPKSFVYSFLSQISSQLWEVYNFDNKVIGTFKTQFDMHQECLLLITSYIIQIEPELLSKIKPPLLPIYLLESLSDCPIVTQLAYYGISLLSSQPLMLKQLNEKINIRLQNKDFPVVHGLWNDLMIQCWCEKLLTSQQNINPHQVVSIFKNFSPTIKCLQHQSAFRMCQLLTLFSNYDFLLPNPENAKTMFKFITVVNNILLQNLESNEYLLYELLQKQNILLRIEQMQITESKILFFCQKYNEADHNVNITVKLKNNGQNTMMIDKSEEELQKTISRQFTSPQKDFNIDEEQKEININDEQKRLAHDDFQQHQRDDKQIIAGTLSEYQKQTNRLKQLWANYDFQTAKNNSPIQKLHNFIASVRSILIEKKIFEIELHHIQELLNERNLTCLLDLDTKLSLEQFDYNVGYQLVNRLTWQNLFLKSKKAPPFYERSECVYLNYKIE